MTKPKSIRLGDGTLFLTHDLKINAREIAEYTKGEKIKITPEMAVELGEQVMERFEEFRLQQRLTMTLERAEFVRRLRCEHNYSWRALARACWTEWNGDWTPPNNQIMGMALCERAAELFFEDYRQGEWV